jgi:hypothetical protein
MGFAQLGSTGSAALTLLVMGSNHYFMPCSVFGARQGLVAATFSFAFFPVLVCFHFLCASNSDLVLDAGEQDCVKNTGGTGYDR